MRYEIQPCRLEHLRRLAATLRPADRTELLATGGKPRHVLFALWRHSLDPKVAIIDGEVAAAWGDAGDMLSPEGAPWLFTAPPIERVPMAFAHVAQCEIERMLGGRARLVTDTHRDYVRAQRFFRLLGFHVKHPDANGWCRMTIEA